MEEKQIIEALKKILDPEIGISIWDLGLIYNISFNEEEGEAVIKMTLTAPGCPFMARLVDQVREEISALEGVKRARVDLVFDPPWGPERMSEEGRKKLGI